MEVVVLLMGGFGVQNTHDLKLFPRAPAPDFLRWSKHHKPLSSDMIGRLILPQPVGYNLSLLEISFPGYEVAKRFMKYRKSN